MAQNALAVCVLIDQDVVRCMGGIINSTLNQPLAECLEERGEGLRMEVFGIPGKESSERLDSLQL